jgi:SWIM zinc finger
VTSIQITAITQYNITIEQLDRATKIIDGNTVFYQIDSQTNPGTSYNVRFNHQFGCLTCTCLAGQQGIPCWHKRAALAANELDKERVRRERQTEQAVVEATEEYQIEQLFRDLEEALDELDRIAEKSDEREAHRKVQGA